MDISFPSKWVGRRMDIERPLLTRELSFTSPRGRRPGYMVLKHDHLQLRDSVGISPTSLPRGTFDLTAFANARGEILGAHLVWRPWQTPRSVRSATQSASSRHRDSARAHRGRRHFRPCVHRLPQLEYPASTSRPSMSLVVRHSMPPTSSTLARSFDCRRPSKLCRCTFLLGRASHPI